MTTVGNVVFYIALFIVVCTIFEKLYKATRKR
jgi:hypothetical protein